MLRPWRSETCRAEWRDRCPEKRHTGERRAGHHDARMEVYLNLHALAEANVSHADGEPREETREGSHVGQEAAERISDGPQCSIEVKTHLKTFPELLPMPM